ncbi:MAG: VOC family protein [Nitrospirae bacterium]|nr:VOC family protein [Nitrospirota bacterium]
MPRVTHFEISAAEPERAISFYNEVFGWKINKWEGPIEYWLVATGEKEEPGIDGGIMRRGQFTENVVNSIEVPDIDEYIDKVEKAGGKVTQPKMSITGVGYAAYLKDTEGNTFGIMQYDPNAK